MSANPLSFLSSALSGASCNMGRPPVPGVDRSRGGGRQWPLPPLHTPADWGEAESADGGEAGAHSGAIMSSSGVRGEDGET